MKTYTFCILILLLNSCVTISNKKNLIDINDVGDEQSKIKKEGYYYMESEEDAYPYFKNKYGGFSQELTKGYKQKIIVPILLNNDGSFQTMGSCSGFQDNLVFNFKKICNLNDDNSILSAKLHFECIIRNRKKDNSILGNGVFKTYKNKQIIIQHYSMYRAGQFHLVEEKGFIINDSCFNLVTRYDYRLKKTENINETYYFQSLQEKPKYENYIIKHKNKFTK